MKQLSTAIVLLTIAPAAASTAEQTVKLAIGNMTCALCSITVTKVIKRVDGVMDVAVDFATKRAAVRFDDGKTTWQAIAKASTNAGYPASKVE